MGWDHAFLEETIEFLGPRAVSLWACGQSREIGRLSLSLSGRPTACKQTTCAHTHYYYYIYTRIQLHITLYHIIWHEHVRCFPRNDDWQDSWMAESTLGMPHSARNIAKQVSPSAPHLSCLHGLVENMTEWLTWHGNHGMVIWHMDHMDRGKDKLRYSYLGSN